MWKIFGKFYSRLDYKPTEWEDRIILFVAYLVEVCKLKSSTVKSYVSAVKSVLAEDGLEVNEGGFVLNALTRACKLKNDQVILRFPIYKGLLKLILDELKSEFDSQPYLLTMYSALFSSAYFGLLHVGELMLSEHTISVKNVHIGTNKKKILYMLTSSKTHTKGDKPQSIKITSTPINSDRVKRKRLMPYCPYGLIKLYITARPNVLTLLEQFFVFQINHPCVLSMQGKF